MWVGRVGEGGKVTKVKAINQFCHKLPFIDYLSLPNPKFLNIIQGGDHLDPAICVIIIIKILRVVLLLSV